MNGNEAQIPRALIDPLLEAASRHVRVGSIGRILADKFVKLEPKKALT